MTSKKKAPDKMRELGNKEIYSKHLVAIEGGERPTARVLDQHTFDRYLIDGEITLAQHQACEYLLQQAVNAGVFVRGSGFGGTGGGSTSHKSKTPSDRSINLGRTIKLVKNKYGEYGAWLIQEVVLHDYDASKDETTFNKFKKCLDLIVEFRLAGGRNPMRHMRK